MNKQVECIRCHAQMEPGFLPDGTHSGFTQQKWAPGTPQPSFWMGLKLNDAEVVPVVTYRCPSCGYLESYATAHRVSDR